MPRCFVGILATISMMLVATFGVAWADGVEPKQFSSAAFDDALKSGKPVLVEISAPWCPICKTQKPIIRSLLTLPKYKEFSAFDIDFDSGKADVRRLGATVQSTLIVFKTSKEVGRSVGETQSEWIEDLLDKGTQ